MFKPDFPNRPMPKVIGYPFGFTPPLSAVELAKLPKQTVSDWERLKIGVPWFDKELHDFRHWKVIVAVDRFGEFAFTSPCFVGIKNVQKSGKINLRWTVDARMTCTVTGFSVLTPDSDLLQRGNFVGGPVSLMTGDTLNLSYTLSA